MENITYISLGSFPVLPTYSNPIILAKLINANSSGEGPVYSVLDLTTMEGPVYSDYNNWLWFKSIGSSLFSIFLLSFYYTFSIKTVWQRESNKKTWNTFS